MAKQVYQLPTGDTLREVKHVTGHCTDCISAKLFIPERRNGFEVVYDLRGNLTPKGEPLVMASGYKFVSAAGEERFNETWSALQEWFRAYTAALAS